MSLVCTPGEAMDRTPGALGPGCMLRACVRGHPASRDLAFKGKLQHPWVRGGSRRVELKRGEEKGGGERKTQMVIYLLLVFHLFFFLRVFLFTLACAFYRHIVSTVCIVIFDVFVGFMGIKDLYPHLIFSVLTLNKGTP